MKIDKLSMSEIKNSFGKIKSFFDPDKRIEVSSNVDKAGSKDKKFNPEDRINPQKELPEVKKDDNGKEYRIGDNLIPNNTYEKNGYTYKTDSNGRVISAGGKLQVKDHEGKKEIKDSMETIGKGDQKGSDDRGHLIADRFNGSEKMDNLVAMDSKLNKGDYKKMEDKLADAVKDGKDVTLSVRPVYKGDSFRPNSFRVTYTIDGQKTVVTFKNGSETKQ